MNELFIPGDPLEDAPRFVPCALFQKFGAQKVFYKGDAPSVKETKEEQALADVALQKWNYYKTNYRPVEDEFMNRVDEMDSEGAYDFVKGAAGSGTAAAFESAKERMATDLQTGGINPNSGKYKASMAEITDKQGLSSVDSMSRAQIDQQDEFVQGISNISAMGRGQATSAQNGLSDVAGAAARKADSDATNAWNSKAAGLSAAGSVFGAATHAYGNAGSGTTEINRPDSTVG